MTAAERRAFRAGDAALFRRLVESESPHLLGFARALTGDAVDAAELVQATWVHAFEHRESFEGRGPLLGWLLAICRTRHLTQRRASAREAAALSLAARGADSPVGPAGDAALERAESRARIADAVGRLPERQRAVVLSRLLAGASTAETARRLHMAEGTVKATLHAAMRHLRRELESYQ